MGRDAVCGGRGGKGWGGGVSAVFCDYTEPVRPPINHIDYLGQTECKPRPCRAPSFKSKGWWAGLQKYLIKPQKPNITRFNVF